MNHIDFSQFISYQQGKLTKEDYKEIAEHLEACPVCQKQAKAYEQFLLLFKQSHQRSLPKDSTRCYEDSALIEFIEGSPSQKSRAAFYSHILKCQSCMDRLLSLQRVFGELRQEGLLISNETLWDRMRNFIAGIVDAITKKIKPQIPTPKFLSPAYAWVGLILLLCISTITILTIKTSDETQIITRDNQFDVAQREVQLVHPQNNSELDVHKSEFQWSASGDAVAYNFFLLDDRGNILWETKTENSEISLPDNIRLNSDQLYFWRVEALYSDGTSRHSPMTSFTNAVK
jgi:hypothetical protein